MQSLSARNSIQANQFSREPGEGICVAQEDTPDGKRVFYNGGSSRRSGKKRECNFESRSMNSIHEFGIKIRSLSIWVCKTEDRFTNFSSTCRLDCNNSALAVIERNTRQNGMTCSMRT